MGLVGLSSALAERPNFDFYVELGTAEGVLESFLVPVCAGQRISDAAEDYARRRGVPVDEVLSVELFERLCPSHLSQSPEVVECESALSNTILSTLVMHEVKDLFPLHEVVVEMLIFVRRGYSASQQATFACSYYDCSSDTFLRVYENIAQAMKNAAFAVFHDDPFALNEGPSLSHLMTYCLSALQDDQPAQQYCAQVDTLCEIEAFCPPNGELKRMHMFCQILFDNNNTGSTFFHMFQNAYNVPNASLVPTPDYYRSARIFSYAMVTQSKLMIIDNPVYRLLRVVSNSYFRESFSPYATNAIKTDGIGRSKISFHLKHLQYLAQQAKRKVLHINPTSSRAEFRSHAALEAYFNQIIQNFKKLSASFKSEPYVGVMKNLNQLDETQIDLLANSLYNRNIYQRPFFPNGTKSHLLSLPKLNPLPSKAQKKINDQFENEHLVVVDDFLHPDILEELYMFCVESTIWHVSDKSLYVGSYWDEGLSHPLLTEIAKEITRIFPFVGDLPLVHMWAYNFDSKKEKRRRSGVDKHMDSAMINLNLWLTPDDANLNPTSGGLIVWLKDLFSDENNPNQKTFPFHEIQNSEFGNNFLKGSEHLNVTIPYKRNRVVIFNSALWHTTDDYQFSKSHEKRRINLTFLFGKNKNILG